MGGYRRKRKYFLLTDFACVVIILMESENRVLCGEFRENTFLTVDGDDGDIIQIPQGGSGSFGDPDRSCFWAGPALGPGMFLGSRVWAGGGVVRLGLRRLAAVGSAG